MILKSLPMMICLLIEIYVPIINVNHFFQLEIEFVLLQLTHSSENVLLNL